ncbi:MAG: hypothetical protein FJ102_15145 [Deltaproteobacteria bacterium]|nr:hypothetical protein [Deltaproteobacteria bacterium]
MLLALLGTLHAADNHLLFLGNSYTFVNDLDQVSLSLFAAAAPSDVYLAVRLAEGGYTLPMHLAEADGTMGETAWSDALVTGTTEWDWVMLQDQSQIPGFPPDEPTFQESLAALPPLDAMVAAKHGRSVLLMTWGRREGDADNPTLYPDYLTMQSRLEAGYQAYAAAIDADERPAYIAPAGLAWRHVYEANAAQGVDPLESGSLFHGLYSDDGSHPSPLGTYLAACVVFATITGEDPAGLPAPDAVPAELVATLQEAARATVFDETPEYAYPWRSTTTPGDSGDTGQEDTSTGDTATGDTATGDTATAAGRTSCGCDAGAGSGGAGSVGVGAAAVTAWVRRKWHLRSARG